MLNYKIEHVTFSKDIQQFLKTNHYTQTFPVAVKFCFTLTDEHDKLLGVILYSCFSRRQAAQKYQDYLELSRLFIIDGTPKNTESYFISKTLKYLKAHTKCYGIIAYADPSVGHIGTIYKASNFKYLGETKASYHYQKDDLRIHKKKIWVEAKSLGIKETEHAKNLGLTKVPELPKFIYQFNFDRIVKETGIIYKAILPNGKVYIGQTTNRLERRKRQHFSDAKNPKKKTLLFHKALIKYNFDVIFEVIETALVDKLNETEVFWMKHYKSDEYEYGYNGDTQHFLVGRTPDSVLFEFFRLKLSGFTQEEIAKKFNVSVGFVGHVINGKMHPDIRLKWSEEHPLPEKYKSVDDTDVLKMFSLRDSGLGITEIAAQLGVTKTYVSLVLNGKMRTDLKEAYERQTGRKFEFNSQRHVDRDLALKVLHLKHDEKGKLTNKEIGEQADLTEWQVDTIIRGKTANDTYNKFFEGKKPRTCFKYTDDLILKAFDFRFKENMSSEDVAERLGIDKSFLSMLCNGKSRPELKEKWEAENGLMPSIASLRSKAGSVKKGGKPVVASDGRRWSSATSCAKDLECSPTAVCKAIKNKTECKSLLLGYE